MLQPHSTQHGTTALCDTFPCYPCYQKTWSFRYGYFLSSLMGKVAEVHERTTRATNNVDSIMLSRDMLLLDYRIDMPSFMPCSPAIARPIAMKNTSSMKIPQQSFHLADYQIRD
ncbi:hypothetical protein TNCV_1993841 [Trichonephila clavipes]|nr:hypothetical protein TNCV_1993841 [Trichonephila clavipes]